MFVRQLFGAVLLAGVSWSVPARAAPACDPDNGGLKLPPGFCALVVADGVGPARHLAVAPNGDVFVALQGGARRQGGGVVALRDTNGDGKFETKEQFGDGQHHRHRAAQRLPLRRARSTRSSATR